MGIIRTLKNTIGGSLSDQWLEVIRAENMNDSTVMTMGSVYDRKGRSKGSADVISNGSVIHVEQNQFMILTDGGRIVDYTAEPGYFKVDSNATPSMLNGEFDQALKDTFERFRFQGQTPYAQKVYFINTQEIKNIAFGTSNPVNYFDNFYNAELFLRAFGYFSIRITDPLKFFAEALPRDARHVEIGDINNLYLAEFLTAVGTTPVKSGVSLADLIRRPQVTYESLAPFDPDRPDLPRGVTEEVGIALQDEGYIKRQLKQVEEFSRMEARKLPADLDYETVPGLRLEARQKLNHIRPDNFGQASRISGVSPADIAALMVWMEK